MWHTACIYNCITGWFSWYCVAPAIDLFRHWLNPSGGRFACFGAHLATNCGSRVRLLVSLGHVEATWGVRCTVDKPVPSSANFCWLHLVAKFWTPSHDCLFWIGTASKLRTSWIWWKLEWTVSKTPCCTWCARGWLEYVIPRVQKDRRDPPATTDESVGTRSFPKSRRRSGPKWSRALLSWSIWMQSLKHDQNCLPHSQSVIGRVGCFQFLCCEGCFRAPGGQSTGSLDQAKIIVLVIEKPSCARKRQQD